ncbi:MAG: carboxylating nicotinate-nucleotide diphosphorylase [Cellvibrio sp.]|nr:carboxylating nicotinate-nucleotide diphosphorylase [Cellvibrio sp.]
MINIKRFSKTELTEAIVQQVSVAIAEDLGTGDLTASLIPENKQVKAQVITREEGIFCGKLWVDQVFRQLDGSITIDWLVDDGDKLSPNQCLFRLSGNARSILTGERTALNFIQTLSGTATQAYRFSQAVKDLSVKILDTRKTLPCLRLAQKYAVLCGKCENHRIGLYDAFLIKENHIAACGSIKAAITQARSLAPNKPVEVEVENFTELNEAIAEKADIIMLDNFSLEEMKQAVKIADGKIPLEASGNMNMKTLVEVAKTGVDFISIGALTKHCQALDLSLRIIE